MITPEQIRIARAFLDWSTEALSEQTGISASAISKIERKLVTPHRESIHLIQKAFELSGIEFLPANGIKLRENIVEIWEDEKAHEGLLDDVFYELRDTGGCVRVFGPELLNISDAHTAKKLAEHAARLADNGIRQKTIVRLCDVLHNGNSHGFHVVDDVYAPENPIYIYASKVAFLVRSSSKVLIVNDPRMAESVGKLFDFTWDRTKPYQRAKGKQA